MRILRLRCRRACLARLFLVFAGSTLCFTHAQVVRQITDYKVDVIGGYAVDDSGDTVVAVSSADAFGGNAPHALQIVKWTFPGGVASQVGSLSRGVVRDSISITDDGSTIAFISPSDPLGTNHDGSLELFLISSDGSTIDQLTNDPALDAGSVLDAMISGSGNRVMFLARTDPLGTNPGNLQQLFVIDTDGSNLVQLASAGGFFGISISDDGQRIAFCSISFGDPNLFKVEADGSNLTQLTDDFSRFPMISGNGNWIVFYGPGEVAVMSWTGVGPTVLASGQNPSITDDGMWVYFSEDAGTSHEIFTVRLTGGPTTQLTFTSPPVENRVPVVSGDNSRVLFRVTGGAHAGGNNPDGGSELMIMDAGGTNVQQLSANDLTLFDWEPDVTPDGSRVVFLSFDPLGTTEASPHALVGPADVFLMRTDGTELTAVTSGADAHNPSVTADGNTIAFTSQEDLTGQNPPCSGDYFYQEVFTIQADGTGLTQRTPSTCSLAKRSAVISRDGTFVVFQSDGELDGPNPAGSELFAVSLPGGTFTQITDDDDGFIKQPRLSDDGLWVTYNSRTNLDGMNPAGNREVFRARTDGSVVERITGDPDPLYSSWRPDISGDGSRIVYASTADPLGTNPEHNFEIFLYDATPTTTQQLTFTTTVWPNQEPVISGDGAYAYFWSSSPYFEENPDNPMSLYRVTVATGLIERASGLRDPRDRSGRSS